MLDMHASRVYIDFNQLVKIIRYLRVTAMSSYKLVGIFWFMLKNVIIVTHKETLIFLLVKYHG